jgi:hypothetical protein
VALRRLLWIGIFSGGPEGESSHMAKDSRPPADTRSITRLREHIYPTKQYTNIVIGIIWNVNSALHIEVLQSKMLKPDPQNERAGARRK